MNKGVKYIDDIIKETAKELGRDEKEVKEAWQIHIKYVKSLMDREDVHVITLPKLGNLFFNIFTHRNLSHRTSKDTYKGLDAKADKLREIIKEDYQKEKRTKYTYPQNRRAAFYTLFRAIQWNIFKRKKSYSTFKKVIETIEQYSLNKYRELKGE